MKFPISMLLDYVSTALSAAEIGDLLTMAGFELEGLEKVGDEWVLDIKVPSNRGDGLSVLGLAREVLAKDVLSTPTDLYELAANRFKMPDESDEGEAGCLTSVAIQTSDCGRYACRLFRGIGTHQTPQWIADRLEATGQRSISLLVDLTNYVMLELGQPLHAFDMDKLAEKRIVVRKARLGEKLTTLDGNEHELREDQMMICDAEKPVAAAGVMGGLETEVTGSTQNVLLESAHFLNTSIRRTRKQLGLNTDASYRFERSVDPDGVVAGLNRFAMLLAEVDEGASLVLGVVDEYPGKKALSSVQLRMSRAVKLLGMPILADYARNYLARLGMLIGGNGEPFTVIPPSWRPDVEREDDLIEDIGRVHGYDLIPETLTQGSVPQGGVLGDYHRVDLIREAALRCGFDQIISHSLRDVHPLDPICEKIGPRNPNAPDMATLRPSLLPCLADAARRNGAKDLHLFEIGRVFYGDNGPKERRQFAMMSMGSLIPGHWTKADAPTADFFSLKGSLMSVLESIGVEVQLDGSSGDPRFHPTRQARLLAVPTESDSSDPSGILKGMPLGIMGQIHPDIAESLSLPAETVMAEIDIEALMSVDTGKLKYRAVSRNPAVRRDIAILITKQTSYSAIEQTIEQAAGEVLEKQWLFDVYEGKGIPDGSHSLAIALQLRKMGGNFTDEEANQVRDRVVAALEAIGASRR